MHRRQPVEGHAGDVLKPEEAQEEGLKKEASN